MCKLLRVVYFTLFLVNIVESYHMQDGTLADVRRSKNHHHHKTRSTLNAANKTSDGEEPKENVSEKSTEKLETDHYSGNYEGSTSNNATDDKFGRTGDIPRTTFVDSSGKMQQKSEDESSSSDDYSDSFDSDEDISNVQNVDNLTDDTKHSQYNDTTIQHDSGEVLIDTSNIKTLSQDAVLDLKARSGLIRSEDDNTSSDSNPPAAKMKLFPQFDPNLRSGYIPLEEIDDGMKPSRFFKTDAHPLNRLISPHQDNQPSQFNKPNDPRSEMLYKALINSHLRYSPFYFDSISSKETSTLPYPILNSREIWSQGNTGQRTKPYYGLTHPNSQIDTKYGCHHPQCTQRRGSSHEPVIQSADENARILKTANGRSVSFDPTAENAYPLFEDTYEEVNHGRSNEQGSFKEMLKPRETHASQEVEPSNFQTDLGSYSKLLLAMPSLIPRSSLLLRRVGLGGAQIFIK